LEIWGSPQTPEDISRLFVEYLDGSLKVLPWSEEEGLSAETKLIEEDLIRLNKLGLWTVASQPAVNGVKSTDEVFGWGPKNGFVFQKAFVELFIPSQDWKILHEKLKSSGIRDDVSFYASNAAGDFDSSDNAIPIDSTEQIASSTNAVTWGAFPGKEIITPTIIEEVSFKAWSEEAFGIWQEWGRVYSPKSQSRELIDKMVKDRWLVNVIHHAYVEPEALWDLLLS